MIGSTLVGTLASVVCLLFLEPLTGEAALGFVYNNFMYFGGASRMPSNDPRASIPLQCPPHCAGPCGSS